MLDSIYFATYTITTTGYGDIIPNSSYAKFITIILNIFELAFIVLAVNLFVTRHGCSYQNGNLTNIANPVDSNGNDGTTTNSPDANKETRVDAPVGKPEPQ